TPELGRPQFTIIRQSPKCVLSSPCGASRSQRPQKVPSAFFTYPSPTSTPCSFSPQAARPAQQPKSPCPLPHPAQPSALNSLLIFPAGSAPRATTKIPAKPHAPTPTLRPPPRPPPPPPTPPPPPPPSPPQPPPPPPPPPPPRPPPPPPHPPPPTPPPHPPPRTPPPPPPPPPAAPHAPPPTPCPQLPAR